MKVGQHHYMLPLVRCSGFGKVYNMLSVSEVGNLRSMRSVYKYMQVYIIVSAFDNFTQYHNQSTTRQSINTLSMFTQCTNYLYFARHSIILTQAQTLTLQHRSFGLAKYRQAGYKHNCLLERHDCFSRCMVVIYQRLITKACTGIYASLFFCSSVFDITSQLYICD